MEQEDLVVVANRIKTTDDNVYFERGDELKCISTGDQRDWEYILSDLGYRYSTNPNTHVITILDRLDIDDGR